MKWRLEGGKKLLFMDMSKTEKDFSNAHSFFINCHMIKSSGGIDILLTANMLMSLVVES